MKKNFLLILCLLFSPSLSAGKGIVLVLEAPLLRKPHIKSKVVQRLRKGQKIYIHDKHFFPGPFQSIPYSAADLEKIKWLETDPHPHFYLSMDKVGNDAYIPKEYIKLITGDEREFSQRITPFQPDPTDYRIEEPLPEGYPLNPKHYYRGQFSFLIGPPLKGNYLYPQSILKEDLSTRKGFSFSYTHKISWDHLNRFYFGGNFHLWTSRALFTLFDFTQTQEARGQLGLGPYLSYDAWRSDDYQLTLQGTLSLNWNRIIVSQNADDGAFEERSFSGFSLTPRLGSFFQKRNIWPKLDLLLGLELQLHPPSSLKSSTPVEISPLWQEAGASKDVFNIAFGASWTFFFGFQSQY